MASAFITPTARLSVCAAACFIAAAGYGQDASPPLSPSPLSQTDSAPSGNPARAADTVGDIVVTAQRREQRLQDVPISVAVTTGETVTKNGIRDLADLAAHVPGLRIGTNTLSDNLNIRGIGSGVNAGFEQSVGTFVDGVYRGRSRVSRASLFDVERVEVLKGPQTTFFGNNTIAGALNITSRKPSETFGYNATALFAPTDDEYIAEAGVTGPLTDTLSARGAIKFSGMSGYIYNAYTKQDEPHLRDVIGRISFRWEPSSTFRSDLRFDRAHNRDRGTYSAEIRGCPPGSDFGNVARGSCALYLTQKGGVIDNSYNWKSDVPPSFFRLDLDEAAWTNSLDLGSAALTSISSYFHDRTSTLLQAQAVPVPGVGGTISRSPFENQERYTNYSQELRLESRGRGWLQYVVGGYYSHGDLTNNSYSSLYGVPTVGAAGAPVTSANTPIGTLRNLYQIDQTRSVFGQLTARMTSSLRASAALRYTSVKKTGHRSFFNGIGSATPGPGGFVYVDDATEAKLIRAAGGSKADFADPHTTYNKLMPAFNVQYDIVPTMTGYASYTKGFKAGGYSDSNTPVQFKSEVADAYEVGIKGSFLDRKIFFTLDAFYGKYGNLQEALTSVGPTGTFITTVGNAAKAVSKGIEFSTTAKATSLISFNLDGTYNDATYRDYTNGQCGSVGTFLIGASCIQDLSGRPRAYAPKWTGTVGADIGMPIGARRVLHFVPSVYYSSSYYLTPQIDPLLKQSDFATFDMRVAYGPDGGRWEIAVIGKNLTNAHVQDTAIALGTAAGTTQAILRRARSVAFSFSIKQ
jgi:iron complex outermembrane receptor protein